MVFIPDGAFLMGSTEAEIEDAIAICQQHYAICNHWYYKRENLRRPVSLNDYWIDQTEAGYISGSYPVTITDINVIKTGIVISSDAAHPRTMWELN